MTVPPADWMNGPGCPDCGSHAWRTKVLPRETLIAQNLCTNVCHNPPQPAPCKTCGHSTEVCLLDGCKCADAYHWPVQPPTGDKFETLLTKVCGLIDSSEGRLVSAVALTEAHRNEVSEARAAGVAEGRREMAREIAEEVQAVLEEWGPDTLLHEIADYGNVVAKFGLASPQNAAKLKVIITLLADARAGEEKKG